MHEKPHRIYVKRATASRAQFAIARFTIPHSGEIAIAKVEKVESLVERVYCLNYTFETEIKL